MLPDEQSSPLLPDEQLRILAERLLSAPYPAVPLEKVQLFPGALPPNPPVDVPVPEGALVVGSLLRGEQEIQVVLDVSVSGDAVLNFYRTQMTTAGWQEMKWPHRVGFAFQPGPPSVVFCHGRHGPALTISAQEVPGAPTDTRLFLMLDPQRSPCRTLGPQPGLPTNPFPELAAPPGARLLSGGGMSGQDHHWHSTVRLETDRGAAGLAAHYGVQLQAAGWTPLDQGTAGPSAWSTWRYTDAEGESWSGTLLVLEVMPKPGQVIALLDAELLA